MNKHSPLPWKRAKVNDSLVLGADGKMLGDITERSVAECQANADLIVRAVNSYEDLLEAAHCLAHAIRLLELVKPHVPMWNEGDEGDLIRFRAAVKQKALREIEEPPTLRERIREAPGKPDEPEDDDARKRCPNCVTRMRWAAACLGWYCGQCHIFVPEVFAK